MNDLHDEYISRLYKKTRIEEPPMALDSAILTQARKVVEKRSLWRRTSWLVPLTTVALTVLTVSVVIQMKQEHPEIIAPASIEQPALKSAPKSKPVKKELMKDELRQAEPAKAMKRKSAAPAPMMEIAPAEDSVKSAPVRSLSNEEKKQESIGRLQFRERDSEAGAVAPSMNRPAALQAAPEAWIAKIRALLEAGKKEEAIKELKLFRAAYPDYELPADLKMLNE
jgi:hypothetical protein